MENGQQEPKSENTSEETADQVKDEKPVVKTEVQTAEADDENKEEVKEEEKEVAKVKEEPADEPEPTEELLEKIRKQVEFYFGDINMHKDRFLIEQTKLDEGWIPMNVMLNFKLLASLSKNTDVILKAIEKSDLMEISEDRRKIRRSPKHPLPHYNEEYRKTEEARTIYVKGFPLVGTTMDVLMEFFKDYEPHEVIRMRKYLDKGKKWQFKGSVFVQFKTLEDAKAFMARESVKYEKTELIRKWSPDYAAEKEKEKEEKRQKRAEQKEKKNEDIKKEEQDGDDDGEGKKSGLPKGSVIHISGVSPTSRREDIRECLTDLEASIVFIDFNKGDTEGWVRLQGENSAAPVVEKMEDNTIIVNDTKVTCRVLEGEEEEKYLAKAKEEMANVRQRHIKSKRGGRRGRNGQRGGRKRTFHSSRNEVPSKKAAVE